MPEHGIRGMRPIVVAGVLPQFKQYGSTSTRSIQNENAGGSDAQSQFFVTPPTMSRPKAGGVGEIFNAAPFTEADSVNTNHMFTQLLCELHDVKGNFLIGL